MSADDAEDFSQAGFRVPTMMASPYTRPGFVDHREYDHSSILRFLEWRFLGAPSESPLLGNGSWFLTNRDRNAGNLGASLLPTMADPAPAFDLDIQIAAPSDACAPAGSSLRALQSSSGDDAFNEDAWRTYLDQVGFSLA